MGHNVWMHLESVQRANRMCDSGVYPDMMVHPISEEFNVTNLIDRIFSTRDRQKSLEIINGHAKVWERVVGTRGYTGKRAVNAHTQYNNLFSVVEEEATDELDQSRLDQLEDSV
jgi:hypothetical protein